MLSSRKWFGMRRVVALIALVALGGCTEATEPKADPGTLRVVVDQMPSNVGGILVELEGQGIEAVTAASVEIIPISAHAGGQSYVLIGQVQVGQTVLTIRSADRRTLPVVRVTQVAGSATVGYQQYPTNSVVFRVVE